MKSKLFITPKKKSGFVKLNHIIGYEPEKRKKSEVIEPLFDKPDG